MPLRAQPLGYWWSQQPLGDRLLSPVGEKQRRNPMPCRLFDVADVAAQDSTPTPFVRSLALSLLRMEQH